MCQEIRKNISYVAVPLAMMAFGFLSGRTPQGLSHARHTTPNAVAEVIAKASMPAPLEYRAVESVADALSREHADETLWAVSSWLTKAGSEDLPEMVLRLGGLSDSHLRAASLRRVLDLWVQQSQDVAWQWSRGHMESLSAAFGESYWKILFGALARQDSKTAKLHLAELSGEEYISARGSIESVLRLTSEREALLFLLGEESLGSASAASALMELLASEEPLNADEFRDPIVGVYPLVHCWLHSACFRRALRPSKPLFSSSRKPRYEETESISRRFVKH